MSTRGCWVVLLLLAGCGLDDVVATFAADGATSRDAGDAEPVAPTPTPIGAGNTVVTRDECGGVTQLQFGYALCTCEDLEIIAPFSTDSYDARAASDLRLGRVGVGGSVTLSVPASIGGSLHVSGSRGIQGTASGAALDVFGSLAVGGPISGMPRVWIADDASVDGDVGANELHVGGTLTTPPGASVDSALPTIGATRQAAVDVAAPCACAPEYELLVAPLVDAHRLDNDNTSAGLDASSLAGYSGDTRFDLSSGRYYFDGVHGTGSLVLAVQGRVAIYIRGDILPDGPFELVVSEAGEVDVLVTGVVSSADRISIGNPARPWSTRVFLGGAGPANLAGEVTFGGHVYARRTHIRSSGELSVLGSFFAGRIESTGGAHFNYDETALDLGPCP